MSAESDLSLIVGYASDMGAAEYVAMQFADACKAAGIDATETELNDIPLEDLQSATHFIAFSSTFGDGEFPDNGTVFWESLSAPDAARLEHLSFAVLALGDRSYPLFCQAGKDLDERLEALGGTRLAPRVDCDCCYEKDAGAWSADVFKILEALRGAAPAAAAQEPPTVTRERSEWDRNRPFTARVLVNRLLTAEASDKEVRHFEIDLGDSGITYAAGDSIAIQPTNDPDLVAAILHRLGVGPEYRVVDEERGLGELLTEQLEIRTPSRDLQTLVAGRTADAEAAAVLAGDDPAALDAWLYDRDVLDLLDLADLSVEEVLETLRPLQFRDYSIASSAQVHPGHVHLTVAAVRHDARGRTRGGVASTFLADRCQTVRVHPRPNHNFRLPGPEVPIIMVGPGTGIAPFRGFLQERQATGARGRSWLFFGDRHRATDYLYGEELQGFVDAGVLTRLDLAFSRDGADKVYVQHHMRRHAAELFDWLEDGAYLYVCGDADRMAKDVDSALHEIVAQAGNRDAAAAHAYVNELIKAHRYVRDVY